MGLQRPDHDVLRPEVGRIARRPLSMPALAAVLDQRQAVLTDRGEGRAARHHDHLSLTGRRELRREVSADRAGAEDADAHQARPSFWASPMRWSLPVAPFGISSRMSTVRGTLKSASRADAKARMSRSPAAAPSLSTIATATSSPSMASGTATAT